MPVPRHPEPPFKLRPESNEGHIEYNPGRSSITDYYIMAGSYKCRYVCGHKDQKTFIHRGVSGDLLPSCDVCGRIARMIPYTPPRFSIKPVFAWYDLWVGVFIDRPKHRVYIFPLPCVGIVIKRNR